MLSFKGSKIITNLNFGVIGYFIRIKPCLQYTERLQWLTYIYLPVKNIRKQKTQTCLLKRFALSSENVSLVKAKYHLLEKMLLEYKIGRHYSFLTPYTKEFCISIKNIWLVGLSWQAWPSSKPEDLPLWPTWFVCSLAAPSFVNNLQ